MESRSYSEVIVHLNPSASGDALNFTVDHPMAEMSGGGCVLKDVFLGSPVKIGVRGLETFDGWWVTDAIATLGATQEVDGPHSLHFERVGKGCLSPAITTPVTQKHEQVIALTVVAWSETIPATAPAGSEPRTARGRVRIKIVRIPDGGG